MALSGFLPSRLWQKVEAPQLSYPANTITSIHTGRNRMNQNIPSKLVALIPLLSGSVNDGYNRMINTIILCNAAASGDTNTVNALLARHPRLTNQPDEDGQTALHHAACAGHNDTVTSLLALGADVNRQTHRQQETPLHLAVKNQRLDVVSTLLDHNAEVDCPNRAGKTPLTSACFILHRSGSRNLKAIIARLIQAGASINLKNSRSCPIYHAVMKNNLNLVKYLISMGANPNQWDWIWRTPMHQAVIKGNNSIIKALVAGGADPDHTVCPPISLAIVKDYCNTVRTLAECGASLHLDVKFSEAIEEVVFPWRFDVDAPPQDHTCGRWPPLHKMFESRMSPLRFCVLTEKADIIRILLQKGHYSQIELADMEDLAQHHKLDKSTKAIDNCREYTPPVSLKVLCGRTIKKLVVGRNADTKKTITQLPIPVALHRFLQWHI